MPYTSIINTADLSLGNSGSLYGKSLVSLIFVEEKAFANNLDYVLTICDG